MVVVVVGVSIAMGTEVSPISRHYSHSRGSGSHHRITVHTQPLHNLADFPALAGTTLAVNKDDKQMVCAFIQQTSACVYVCVGVCECVCVWKR